ncbi:MAG: uracil-DNA glycosylase family protein [Candidatus Dojkabacteria bacterium]
MQQVNKLHLKFDELQLKYGDPTLSPIYGAGNVNTPEIMFIFMNPTGRNVSSSPSWKGLRAPWLGTKQVWSIFNDLELLDSLIYGNILSLKQNDWDVFFSEKLYKNLEESSVYITNLAKCTQVDARPLKNNIFKEYLPLMYEEIDYVKPKRIVTFGNQVSSILLNKAISVGNYLSDEKEDLKIQNTYNIYPTYYPVGQGRRNMPLAIERIKRILVL